MTAPPPLTDDELTVALEALRTGDRAARQAAATQLKRAPGWDVARLVSILDHPHVSRRAKGVEIAGARGGAVAVALLVARLDDPDDLIRDKAVRALAKVGQVGRDLVIEALRNAEEGPQRLAILEAACRLADERAVAPALALAADRRPQIRALALHLLRRLDRQVRDESFLAGLADADPIVRAAAVDVMGRMQRPAFLAPLIARLLEEPLRPFDVYRAIQKYGGGAVDALVAAATRVSDGESRVRIAEVLHICLADQSARQRFGELWARPQPAVRDACLLFLGDPYARSIDSDERLRNLMGHVADPEPHRRAACVRALERLAETHPEARPLLESLARDPLPHIAEAAARALRALPPRRR